MKTTTTLFALAFSAVALAQGGAPAFEEVDSNADGAITREEASVIEGLDFDRLDANQDGLLSREEYTAAQEE
jgi:hypothetical protein